MPTLLRLANPTSNNVKRVTNINHNKLGSAPTSSPISFYNRRNTYAEIECSVSFSCALVCLILIGSVVGLWGAGATIHSYICRHRSNSLYTAVIASGEFSWNVASSVYKIQMHTYSTFIYVYICVCMCIDKWLRECSAVGDEIYTQVAFEHAKSWWESERTNIHSVGMNEKCGYVCLCVYFYTCM